MVQGELPREQKLDLGFSCFIRHLMVQGELPRDQKLDVELDVGFF